MHRATPSRGGWLQAIDATNGKTLYRFNTGGTIGGGVISYEIGGKQYVATTLGIISAFLGRTGQ